MHKPVSFYFIFFCFFLLSPANAEEFGFKLNGWAKSTASLIDNSAQDKIFNNEDISKTKKADTRFRAKLHGRISDILSLDCAYEIFSVYETENNRQEGMFFNTGITSYRADDINQKIYSTTNGNDSFFIIQNLDRFFFTLSLHAADIYVGRQTIGFGSARFINPLDVITSFSFDTIDKEEKRGSDAIRARIPFGEMGEIDTGLICGDSFEIDKSAAYINVKFSVDDFDYTFMGMVFMENLLLGLDFQTSILDAGYWLEAGYILPDAVKNSNSDEDYLRVSTGCDYNLSPVLYAFIEYHYNGAGSASTDNYIKLGDKTAYHEGRVYLLSRHYLIPGCSWEITPLCNAQASVMINLLDGSAFISPWIEYSLSENFYLEAGAFICAGEKSSATINSIGRALNNIESEFGLYQNIYFCSLRFYF